MPSLPVPRRLTSPYALLTSTCLLWAVNRDAVGFGLVLAGLAVSNRGRV